MNRTILGAAGAALVAGLATLALNAPQPASAQEQFQVTAQQLKINQRISQAAVRRANAALARLDAVPAAAEEPKPLPPAPLTHDQVSIAFDAEIVPPGETRTAEIPCAPGRLGTNSVGYTLPPTAVGIVYESRPRPGGGWLASFRNDGTEPVTFTLGATCTP